MNTLIMLLMLILVIPFIAIAVKIMNDYFDSMQELIKIQNGLLKRNYVKLEQINNCLSSRNILVANKLGDKTEVIKNIMKNKNKNKNEQLEDILNLIE